MTPSFDMEEVWGKKGGGDFIGVLFLVFVDYFFDRVEAHKALSKCSMYIFGIDSYVDFHR